MLENIKFYHQVKYQVDPTDQTQDNGQNHIFGTSDHSKNAFLTLLNDPSWPGSVAEC